ncbi:MAG: hypothetical protein K2W95_24725 [Candidatus Obscuribacterales bacterium]|nr:hypothetical protein [Candidatus Obscuribacterales bacterium]
MADIKNQIDFDNDKNDTGSDLSQSVWELIENDEREQLPVADKGLRKCPPKEDSTKPLEFVPIPGLDQRLVPSSGKNDELEQLSNANKELRTIKCPPAEPGGGKSGGPGDILGAEARPLPPGSRPTEPGPVEPLLERIHEKPNAMKELGSLSNRSGSAENELGRIAEKQNAMKLLESLSTKVGVAATLLERIAERPDAMKVLESLGTKSSVNSLTEDQARASVNREAVIKALRTFMTIDNRSPVPSVKPVPSGPAAPSGDHPIVDTPRPRGR